jgi:hypothetical protein
MGFVEGGLESGAKAAEEIIALEEKKKGKLKK